MIKTAFLAASCFLFSFVFADNETIEKETAEINLEKALAAMTTGEVQKAKSILIETLEHYPNFHLARMVYADLIAAQARHTSLLPNPAAQGKARISGLVEEAAARLKQRARKSDKLPANIVRLSQNHEHALLFDARYARLYVFENNEGMPHLIADYYASAGKEGMNKESEGDNRTPSGVYKITHTLDDDQLPELYGLAAYVLNYPNQWDQTQRRSGSGIWLHGVPRITYSRPPETSRGCVVSSNWVMQWLKQHINPTKTPVILATQVDWLDEVSWRERRTQLLSTIEQWQSDWQSLDVEQYLEHYSGEYKGLKLNYQQMLKQTRRNAEKKTFVKVAIKNIDLFRYSMQPERYIAHFDQDYKSNNYNISYRKQQIWQREDGEWKIIFEGRA